MDEELADHVRRLEVPAVLRWPRALLLRAIEVGWLHRAALADLEERLSRDDFGGWGVDELQVEPRWGAEGEVEVRFLAEAYACPTTALLELLRAISRSVDRL